MNHVIETLKLLREIAFSKATHRAMLLILPYAGVLIGLDVAAHYGSLTNAELPVQFYLASDRGFGEFLEYSLTMAVAVMMFLLWKSQRAMVYLANAVLFVWLTLDNWLEFHESFGEAFAPVFAPLGITAVEPSHLAEAALLVAIGGFWIVALGLALKAARDRALSFALILASCVVGAALFGVIVDLLVVWGEQGAAFHAALVFIEDGGEFVMIIAAFLVSTGFFDAEVRRANNVARRDSEKALTSGSAAEPHIAR